MRGFFVSGGWCCYEVYGGSPNSFEPDKISQEAETPIYKALTGAVFSNLRRGRFVYTEDVGSSSLSSPTIPPSFVCQNHICAAEKFSGQFSHGDASAHSVAISEICCGDLDRVNSDRRLVNHWP